MSALLLVALLASEPDAPPSLEGNWTVVSFEKDGKPLPDAGSMKVTIQNNTISFAGGEKMKAMRCRFGPRGLVRIVEADADRAAGTGDAADDDRHVLRGVYVLTSGYLAMSVHDPAGDRNRSGDETSEARRGDGSDAKSRVSVILKRSGPAGERR